MNSGPRPDAGYAVSMRHEIEHRCWSRDAVGSGPHRRRMAARHRCGVAAFPLGRPDHRMPQPRRVAASLQPYDRGVRAPACWPGFAREAVA